MEMKVLSQGSEGMPWCVDSILRQEDDGDGNPTATFKFIIMY